MDIPEAPRLTYAIEIKLLRKLLGLAAGMIMMAFPAWVLYKSFSLGIHFGLPEVILLLIGVMGAVGVYGLANDLVKGPSSIEITGHGLLISYRDGRVELIDYGVIRKCYLAMHRVKEYRSQSVVLVLADGKTRVLQVSSKEDGDKIVSIINSGISG